MSQWSWYARGLEGESRFKDRDPHDVYEDHLEHVFTERLEHAEKRHGYAVGFAVPESSEFEVQIRERNGPQDYRRSDMRVIDAVAERLKLDPSLDASAIEADVKDGAVVLTGRVTERWMKKRAEALALSVSGVVRVENRIRLTRE